jgi:Holliday junction resolvase RusA-like endonuclease
MQEEKKIIAPLQVFLPRKTKEDKKVIINLNGYRNWHYIISNEVKKKYKEAIKSQLNGLKYTEPIRLTFKLFKGSKRISDRANVLSIHEKFFCDALTECGVIDDDNDEFIKETKYISGCIDRENPRVEITIAT